MAYLGCLLVCLTNLLLPKIFAGMVFCSHFSVTLSHAKMLNFETVICPINKYRSLPLVL